MKEIKLYNGSICKIDDITDDSIIVIGHIFNHQKFLLDFEPLYCQTVYKYQGSTIKEKFTIHEVSSMTKRELYTSLSRGKSLNQISFKYDAKTFVNRDTASSTEQKVKVNNDIDEKYQAGKIYKITFNNHIYIGSTCRSLKERFEEHLKATSSRAGSLFIETLKKNKMIAKIELIQLYPCASQQQLVAEEEIYINDALVSKFVCLNTMMTKKKSKVKNTEINMDRIELINLGEKEIKIVEEINNNLFRMRYTDKDGNKI
jgi:Uri superfamily endonuclease